MKLLRLFTAYVVLAIAVPANATQIIEELNQDTTPASLTPALSFAINSLKATASNARAKGNALLAQAKQNPSSIIQKEVTPAQQSETKTEIIANQAGTTIAKQPEAKEEAKSLVMQALMYPGKLIELGKEHPYITGVIVIGTTVFICYRAEIGKGMKAVFDWASNNKAMTGLAAAVTAATAYCSGFATKAKSHLPTMPTLSMPDFAKNITLPKVSLPSLNVSMPSLDSVQHYLPAKEQLLSYATPTNAVLGLGGLATIAVAAKVIKNYKSQPTATETKEDDSYDSWENQRNDAIVNLMTKLSNYEDLINDDINILQNYIDDQDYAALENAAVIYNGLKESKSNQDKTNVENCINQIRAILYPYCAY